MQNFHKHQVQFDKSFLSFMAWWIPTWPSFSCFFTTLSVFYTVYCMYCLYNLLYLRTLAARIEYFGLCCPKQMISLLFSICLDIQYTIYVQYTIYRIQYMGCSQSQSKINKTWTDKTRGRCSDFSLLLIAIEKFNFFNRTHLWHYFWL